MRIGAHVSVAGGLLNAVSNARETGSEAFQVFVSNARAWAPPVDAPAADARFRELVAEAGLGPVFAHAPYLVNFASTNDLTYERSRDVTLATLRKAAAIGARGVVVHAGSDLGAGRERGLERIRSAILPLLDRTEGRERPPELLLEFTAGTRNAIASRFEEMAELLQRLGDHPRVTVCFDTCHAHAAGYDLSTAGGATAVMTELLATVGDRVRLVHANDSVEPAGSCKDRHTNIGDGTIGDDGFAAILTHLGLAAAAMVTETPGKVPEQARDVARLKKLREAAPLPAPLGPRAQAPG
jgi:deoxyribonuclease-4